MNISLRATVGRIAYDTFSQQNGEAEVEMLSCRDAVLKVHNYVSARVSKVFLSQPYIGESRLGGSGLFIHYDCDTGAEE